MGPPLIRSITFLDHPPEGGVGCAHIRVEMEDGSASTFTVSTPEDVAGRMRGERRDSLFMEPVVFVRSIEEPVVREAVEAMAAEKGGYWLRYYNQRAENPPKKRPRR